MARSALDQHVSHGTHEFYAERALQPMERTSVWDEGELPETYPWAV